MKMKLRLWKIKTFIVFKEIFQYSLFTYLILLIAETIQEGIVSYFFNLNILLTVVILSGLMMIVTQDDEGNVYSVHKKISYRRSISYIILLCIIGAIIVILTTFDLGFMTIVAGCLAAILILLTSLLLLSIE
jgi:hypothetical protein